MASRKRTPRGWTPRGDDSASDAAEIVPVAGRTGQRSRGRFVALRPRPTPGTPLAGDGAELAEPGRAPRSVAAGAIPSPSNPRDRMAAFATVTEALSRRRLAAPGPAGPRPLTFFDTLRRLVSTPLGEQAGRRAAGTQQATLRGALAGLLVGLLAGGLTLAWPERDLTLGLALTLGVTLSSFLVWWKARSAVTAAAYLGLLLGMLWLLTPASRIVYQSDRDTGYRPQIYMTTADGGSTDRLTSSSTVEGGARLAPHARHLVLAHYQDGNTDIFVTESDGAQPTNLTRHPAEDRAPAWSPNGAEIAFQSNRSGNWDVYVMQADGSRLRKLTSSAANDEAPNWSPDGRTLAFQSDRTGFSHLYILGLRGSVIPLTQGPYHDRLPAWSPDGSRIAFQSNRDGRWQIYTIRPDGADARRVVVSTASDMMPAWSPDGRSLVFTSDRDGNLELYSLRLDTGTLHRLTHTPTDESQPHWVATGPIDWLSLRQMVLGWMGALVPALGAGDSVITIAPAAPRDDSPGAAPLGALGEDILPQATPRPDPAPVPGGVPRPSPTPGLRPVPTCAPGSFWC